jgi:hypothetical protein
LRSDAWCRLEEAADPLTRPTTNGELREEYVAICRELLTTLTPLEPQWAYPGSPQSARVQPDFSSFHPVFRDHSSIEDTPEGDVRRAFYLSYNDANCEYMSSDEIFEKLDAGIDVVSATFVTPTRPASRSSFRGRCSVARS